MMLIQEKITSALFLKRKQITMRFSSYISLIRVSTVQSLIYLTAVCNTRCFKTNCYFSDQCEDTSSWRQNPKQKEFGCWLTSLLQAHSVTYFRKTTWIFRYIL